MNRKTTRRLLAGAGLLALLSGVAATGILSDLHLDRTAAASAAPAPAPAAIPVSVATVKSEPVTVWQDYSGRMEAVNTVDLRARVAGAVLSANFHEGALVKAGDVLVTLDPAPFEAAAAQARAQVAAAQAQLAYSKQELDRGQRLLSAAISQSTLDQRNAAYVEAQANLQADQAALQLAELNLDYTRIRAPISGRVGKIQVTPGNLVAAGSGSPVLTTLVSVDPIYASFDVDDRVIAPELAALPRNADGGPELDRIPVEIGQDGSGKPIRGHLQFVDNQVDTASGTLHLRAVFTNTGGALIPGQFVRVRLGQPHPQPHLLISERAIGTDQDKKFVFVVGPDDRLDYREVTLGDWVDGMRIVTAGLKAGDRIVVDGLQHVRPGALVKPQAVAMDVADAGAAPTEVAQK